MAKKLKKDKMAKQLNKKDFEALVRSELRKYNSTAHPDDQFDFSEWLSENGEYYKKEYGVYFNEDANCFAYTENHVEFPGDDICDCCYDMCTADENGLCPDCAEIEEEV